MPEHAIRLRAGWSARDADEPAGGPAVAASLPTPLDDLPWPAGTLPRNLLLERRFGRPARLDPEAPGARARLVLDRAPGVRSIRLDGRPLTWDEPWAGRLVADLPPLGVRSLLQVEVDLAGSGAAWEPWGEVAVVFGRPDDEATAGP